MTDRTDFASESWICRWVCPDPERLTLRQERQLQRALTRIDQFRSRYLSPAQCVGLEIRLAMLVAGDQRPPVVEGDNGFWQSKCRVLFLRPAVEPVAISYWDKLTGPALDVASAQKIVSALTLKKQRLRTGEGVGRAQSGNVGFELPAQSVKWLDRIEVATRGSIASVFMPAFTFAATIMAHPFGDGNGRLARILTLAAIGKLLGWDYPVVGLAPSFYRNAEALGLAINDLSSNHDWGNYIDVFVDVLNDVTSLMSILNEQTFTSREGIITT